MNFLGHLRGYIGQDIQNTSFDKITNNFKPDKVTDFLTSHVQFSLLGVLYLRPKIINSHNLFKSTLKSLNP